MSGIDHLQMHLNNLINKNKKIMNRDYKEKIIYHMNKLDEALTTANARNIQKSLDSITYFTNKQLETI